MYENLFVDTCIKRGQWGTVVRPNGLPGAVYRAGTEEKPRHYNANNVFEYSVASDNPRVALSTKMQYQLKALYEFGNEQIFQDSSADPAMIMPNLIQTSAVAGVF
jgi:hypothetical protein